MKIQFCGAAKTVTGSCYYIDTGSVKFLVDCGAFQGGAEIEKHNRDQFPFDPSKLDFILLTHAHYDHTGRLPMLVKQGFTGRIISTQPTRDLAKIVLLDAARLQAEDHNRWAARLKDEESESAATADDFHDTRPLFTEDDVHDTMQYFEVYPFGASINVVKGIEARMRDSGHILGSASFEIWIENEDGRTRKIVFSGDLGQPGQRIIRDPDLIREADYVIMESTYGNRLHRSKDETILEFLSVLKEAQNSEGNVIIPTFAVERAQEILYELNLFFENRLLSDLPVFLDSPMALRATEIFKKYPDFYDEDARRLIEKGDDPFEFPGMHYIESVDESKRLIAKKGIVIMAGSGMANGGRVVHHLANNISKKSTHVIFVGYQVHGTLGRKIMDGEPYVRIHGKSYDVRCHVHTLGGFSAHADRRDLMYWIRGFGHSPRAVFICHGEEIVAEGFAKDIREELSIDAQVPSLYEEVTLE